MPGKILYQRVWKELGTARGKKHTALADCECAALHQPANMPYAGRVYAAYFFFAVALDSGSEYSPSTCASPVPSAAPEVL